MTAWNWDAFIGDPVALGYARRDLSALERIIARVPQPRVAVQAGGNLGIYPKRLARSFATVYCFEPDASCFAAMMHNAPEPNIVRLQAAVGVTRELVGLSAARRDGSGRPSHLGLTHVAGAGVIPTLRLDDLALPICDLVCLDVEGYELFALQGALETLQRCRPVVSVELNKNLAHVGHTAGDVVACLEAMGYRQVDQQASDAVFQMGRAA